MSATDDTNRYSPNANPDRARALAALTAAMAQGKNAAIPTACRQRTARTDAKSWHSPSRGAPTTYAARPSSMGPFAPLRSAHGPTTKRRTTARARNTVACSPAWNKSPPRATTYRGT